jgi:hypothetical protein
MPRLPNASVAEIPDEKVRDYLLSTSHPVGRFKASFFFSLGFRREEYLELANAIQRLAQMAEAIPSDRSIYGQKYIVRGTITGPNGRSAILETVWIVLNSAPRPRFVTAYPGD